MAYEADELPEEEVAEARRELHIRRQAYDQDLDRRNKEIDAGMSRRLAAHEAEFTAAAEKPSREVFA